MRKVSPGLVCIVLGVVLLLAAGGLYAYNRYEDAHAGAEAQTVVADLQQKVETPEPEAESGPLDPELPVVEIDGNEYVGEISIPAIGIDLLHVQAGTVYNSLTVNGSVTGQGTHHTHLDGAAGSSSGTGGRTGSRRSGSACGRTAAGSQSTCCGNNTGSGHELTTSDHLFHKNLLLRSVL
jgi:hypothetical protein